MIIATTGRRAGRVKTDAMIAEIEASDLHRLLSGQGFRLQPFRLPAGLHRGKLLVRLTWKKTIEGELQTIRLTHAVFVPDRAG